MGPRAVVAAARRRQSGALFVILLLLALSADIASSAIFDALVVARPIQWLRLGAWLMAFAGVVGLALAAQRVLSGASRWSRTDVRTITWGMLLLILVAGASSALAAITAEHTSVKCSAIAWLVAAVAMCTHAYDRGRQELFAPRTRYSGAVHDKESFAPRKHLILFLSDNNASRGDAGPWPLELRDAPPRSLDELFHRLDGGSVEQKAHRWNWEMPFRSIAPHRGALTGVTLIASRESAVQAAAFAEIFVHIFRSATSSPRLFLWCRSRGTTAGKTGWLARLPDSIFQPATEHGFDFEDFDQLSSTLRELVSCLREVDDIEDRDIVVDVTGGKKPTSIVAAAITFRSDVAAQYISTSDVGRLVPIDVVVDPALLSVG